MRFGNRFQPRRNRIQSLVPAHALKRLQLFAAGPRTLRRSALPFHGIEQPVRRIYAVQILRYFAAQKSLRHRMRRIALHLYRAAFAVDRNQNAARVGAVVRTHGMNNAEWGSSRHSAIVS